MDLPWICGHTGHLQPPSASTGALSTEGSLQSSHPAVWHPSVQCLLLLSPAGVEKGRIWDQHKETLGTFSKQRMGLWIPVDKRESQPEARCFPESSSSCSGTVAVQNLNILQSHKVKVFSISPDAHKPSYIRWLLCPKTYKYQKLWSQVLLCILSKCNLVPANTSVRFKSSV